MKTKTYLLVLMILVGGLLTEVFSQNPVLWRNDGSKPFDKSPGWYDNKKGTSDSIYQHTENGILTIKTAGWQVQANQQLSILVPTMNLSVNPVCNIRMRGTSDSYCALKVTPIWAGNYLWTRETYLQQTLVDTDGKDFFDYKFTFPNDPTDTYNYMQNIGALSLWFVDASNNAFLKGTFEIDEIVLGGELTPKSGLSNVERTKMTIYPNPVVDNFQIFGNDDLAGKTLDIYNILGARCKRIVLKDSRSEVNISDLPAGVYTARIAAGNMLYTNTIIKK